MATMKAAAFSHIGGPDVLQYTDVPKPEPGKGEVLVKIQATGINAVEVFIRGGMIPLTVFPHILGMEAAGDVEKLGEGVTKFKVGDRVWLNFPDFIPHGTYAEYTAAPVKHVHHLPARYSYEEGAALGVAYMAAERALVVKLRARAGETCLVHGASGGIGFAVVQLARALGLRVIATAGTEQGCQEVKDNGAHFVFNHYEDGYTQKILDLTDGKGVEVIVELVADATWQKDLSLVAHGGRIAIIGCKGDCQFSPRLVFAKDITIFGVNTVANSEEEHASAAAHINSGLDLGWVKPRVGKRFPLSHAGEAQNHIMTTKGQGKTVLIPDALYKS